MGIFIVLKTIVRLGRTNPSSRLHYTCYPDRTILVIPTAQPVIPTAVEGSHPVGRRSFGFAQDDRLGCHPDRTIPVIATAQSLSSRPQWRDLIQSAEDPSASLRMTSSGAIPTAQSLSSRPHNPCHPDRTTLSSRPQWRDLIQSAEDPSASLRMTK